MTIINSLDDIFLAFPFVKQMANEFHAPCPFCHDFGRSSETHEYVKNGINFVGDDRFFWYPMAKGFYCRHCQRVYSLEQVCERLFSEFSLNENFVEDVLSFVPQRKPIYLHDETYIRELHKSVIREYWYRFNWTDAIIDKFLLGYGKLYPFSRKASRHIIPFKPSTVEHTEDGYALEGRLDSVIIGESRNVKTQGLSADYFWKYIEGDSDVAILTEGIKDGISAYALGFRHIYSFFGGANAIPNIAEMLVGLRYKTVIMAAHHDDAGQRYINAFASSYEGDFYTVNWPKNAKKGYDVTNLLEDFGDANGRSYLDKNLSSPKITLNKGFVPDVRAIDVHYMPPDPCVAKHKSVVRKELPTVIEEFINNYSMRRRTAGKGVIKVLASDPGSGKSYAMVQMAENLAKKAVLAYEQRCKELDSAIAELRRNLTFLADSQEIEELNYRIDRLTHTRENLSCATVLYAGPFVNGWDDILAQGADETLWFNYEARNKENCENLVNVSQLATKGYSPMAFCQTACPFKARCEERGYLRQERERKKKPITYIRHQQLITSMVSEYKYIFIDENCFSVFDTPTIITAEELVPVYAFWDSYIDDIQQIKLIIEFVEALRIVIRNNKKNNISGIEVLTQLNQQLLGKLEEIVLNINPKMLNEFHPKTVMGEINFNALPTRSLPLIVSIICDEIEAFKEGREYNSGIHIINGQLELYPLRPIHIASSHPIIVSDGTPLPDLYGFLFDREVEIYGSDVYNDSTKTVVWYGSDFTRTSIAQQLGPAFKDFEKWINENPHSVEDIFGESFDLSQVPIDENLYDSSILKRALSLLKSLAEKHTSLLFVTYKNIRILIEKRMEELYPDLNRKISYGHYGSLRGTNRYKDIEAVLLVGCPRIPYDALHRRIQAWGKLAKLDHIPFDLTIRISPYHGVFRYEGHSYISFTADFADSFVNMVEAGEIQQALQRIRPFTSEIPKYVYLALSRPAAKWVTSLDRVGRSANSFDSQKYKDVFSFMKNTFDSTGRFPTFDQIKNNFNVSYSTIAKIKKDILKV